MSESDHYEGDLDEDEQLLDPLTDEAEDDPTAEAGSKACQDYMTRIALEGVIETGSVPGPRAPHQAGPQPHPGTAACSVCRGQGAGQQACRPHCPAVLWCTNHICGLALVSVPDQLLEAQGVWWQQDRPAPVPQLL